MRDLCCVCVFPVDCVLFRSLKYCDERVISCCALRRTAVEQELGLAAYLVCVEERRQHGPHVSSDLSESDPDKLSSTDNEEEETGVDGQFSFILVIYSFIYIRRKNNLILSKNV